MDRRSTTRHPIAHGLAADYVLRVTVLSADGASDRVFAAHLADWSDGGMRLTAAEPLAPGTPVRVDWDDQLALGEVCHCSSLATDVPGGYAIGLRVQQMLTGLDSLRRLADRLMGPSRESLTSR
jgi:hypothetical protein